MRMNALLTRRGSIRLYKRMEYPMIEDYADRHHAFEGCFNFRDVGGYVGRDGRRVKWGKYFRAGRQDRMTAADLEQLETMSIGTQIDLRGNEEIADQGRGPLPGQGAVYHNISVIPAGGRDHLSRLVGDTGISGKRYLGYLSFGPESWQRLFDILSEPIDSAVVIHCTAGKDRTGVSTAFFLSVLGVEREVIEADYLLTNRDVSRQAEFIEQTTGFPEGMSRDEMMMHAGVPETAMRDFLDGVEAQWGSVMQYLQAAGITEAQMVAVRERFLD